MPPPPARGVALSYRAFREHARGWDTAPRADDEAGAPAVSLADFRAKIFPLRSKREWSEGDMEMLLGLEARGLGPALRKVFGSHPQAAKLELRGEHEPFSREELDGALDDMVAAARRDGWERRLYLQYVEYLDARRAPAGDNPDKIGISGAPDDNLFRDAYQAASREVRAYVRRRLLAAAPP